MRIAVRMDDITPDMDWQRFERFKELLDEYGVKPLIGVVPDSQDENLNRAQPEDRSMRDSHGERAGKEALRPTDGRMPDGRGNPEREAFFRRIRQLQQEGWVVALHGYRHVYTQKKGGMFPLNHFSEFAGIPFKRQKEMLTEGVNILRSYGITTDIFMAPAHSYDRNTLKALRELGFAAVTDGFGRRPYRYAGLTFYPVSFQLGLSLKRKKGTTTMVVHTNTMTEQDFARCRRILREERVISYEELLKEEAARRGLAGRAGEYLLATLKHYLVKLL